MTPCTMLYLEMVSSLTFIPWIVQDINSLIYGARLIVVQLDAHGPLSHSSGRGRSNVEKQHIVLLKLEQDGPTAGAGGLFCF